MNARRSADRELRGWLRAFPRLKSLAARVLLGQSVSDHYQELDATQSQDASSRLRSAWQAEELPDRQRKLVDRQIERFRQGKPVDVFDVFVDALRGLDGLPTPYSLLEIGCSSGYYAEVIDIARLPAIYEGSDYSEAFVKLARQRYPALKFEHADATALPYSSESFDVVVSGCCLLHIPEFEQAIAETARVARQYAVFHRTPMVLNAPDKYFRKQAYGVETVEIHFNESDFLALLLKHGLHPMKTLTLSETRQGDTRSATRTYVCAKQGG